MTNPLPALEDIVAHKRKDIQQQQVLTPLASLRALASMQARPQDVSSTIRQKEVALLARVRNPAAGLENADSIPYDPVALARRLIRQGAHALVVSTSKYYHHGGIEHLTLVSKAVDVPVIRDDYIVDEYQVVETRAAGGDGLMLFMPLQDDDQRRQLISATQRNLLTEIAQVHNEAELKAVLPHEPRVIAINNVDPVTGQVDLTTTSRLVELIPGHISVITMGGLESVPDVVAVMTGVDGIIVRQELLLMPDSATALRQLLQIDIEPLSPDSATTPTSLF